MKETSEPVLNSLRNIQPKLTARFLSLVFKPNFAIVAWELNCKRTLSRIENRKSCSLVVDWRMRIWSGATTTRAKYALGWAVRFYHLNTVRTSLWNKTHSRMKVNLYRINCPLVSNKNGKKLKVVVFCWIPALYIKIYMQVPVALYELKCAHVQLKTLGVVIRENRATPLEKLSTLHTK